MGTYRFAHPGIVQIHESAVHVRRLHERLRMCTQPAEVSFIEPRGAIAERLLQLQNRATELEHYRYMFWDTPSRRLEPECPIFLHYRETSNW